MVFYAFTIFAQPDNIIVLSYKNYIKNIINHHPTAKQANLKIQLADAEILAAKGNLDPKVNADWRQKNFDDKLYYQNYQANISLPTNYGISLAGGYENTSGGYLNPENLTDDFGLWFLSIEANVLQGLLVNERTTALDKAKVFQQLAQNEQQIIVNDLLYDASTAYLLWQLYWYSYEVLESNSKLSETYFINTKQTYLNGEKTAMDTLEAYIQFQDAVGLLQSNEQQLTKARFMLENFLWFDDEPTILKQNIIPENYENNSLPKALNIETVDLNDLPQIKATLNKLTYTEIEQRLKREKLKPKLKLKYNPLIGTGNDDVKPNLSFNNFKWGFNFSMPLLLRTERANIEKGAIKIRETKLELENKRNQLQNKIENSWQQQKLLLAQTTLLIQNVDGYEKLLEGENFKFNFGESSVFLLNKRQEKFINGKLKLLKTSIQQQFEFLNYLYYSNQLANL